MTASITIARGYPASGKTTATKKWVDDLARCGSAAARVSRDDIRDSMLAMAGYADFPTEQAITAIQDAAVRQFVAAGRHVVIDDLNLKAKYARRWVDLAVELGAAWQIWNFEVDADTCVARDRLRYASHQRSVGEAVIRDLAKRFPVSKWPTITPTERPEKTWKPYAEPTGSGFAEVAWLVDIDGTLARKRQGDGERGWHEYARVDEDQPIWPVINLVRDLRTAGHQIIFMSGRKDYCRDATRAWLSEHLGSWAYAAPLYMRRDGDNRSDDIVKHELFHAHVNGRYHVAGVVDDRDRVVAMWRAIGLTVAQVAYGDF